MADKQKKVLPEGEEGNEVNNSNQTDNSNSQNTPHYSGRPPKYRRVVPRQRGN